MILGASLSGCARETSSLEGVNLPYRNYSAETMTAASEELDAHRGELETVELLLEDYGELRAALRSAFPWLVKK